MHPRDRRAPPAANGLVALVRRLLDALAMAMGGDVAAARCRAR